LIWGQLLRADGSKAVFDKAASARQVKPGCLQCMASSHSAGAMSWD